MSLTPPSVSRTTPPAERAQPRAERAPAGDFAALLDSAPAPARAPLARAAERRDDRAPAGAHDERPQTASNRSRHAGPDRDRPSGAPGRTAPAPEHSHGGDARMGDPRTPAPPTVDAAGAAPALLPPEGNMATAAAAVVAAAATTPLVTPAAVDLAALPSAAPAPEVPAAVAAAPPAAMAGVLPVVATETAAASAGPALPFAPAGLPLGTSAAGVAEPVPTAAAAASPEGAGASDQAFSGLPAPSVPVSPDTVAAAVRTAAAAPEAASMTAAEAATTAPAETASPAREVALRLTSDARTERSDADLAPAGTAEHGATALPTGTGTGTGAGLGSGSARDGATAHAAASEEIPEAPAGVPAPAAPSAPSAAQGIGRGPDAVPFGPHRSVPLEQSPRAVAQLLHVASQQGVSHARIALRPVELGGIEIFLQMSPAGLAAQVIADSPEAARMLAQATEDLRRSLEGHNVELVSLEVSTSAERQQRDDLASSGFAADDWRAPDGRPASRRTDGGPATAPETPELTTPSVLELPDGLLVDVLA